MNNAFSTILKDVSYQRNFDSRGSWVGLPSPKKCIIRVGHFEFEGVKTLVKIWMYCRQVNCYHSTLDCTYQDTDDKHSNSYFHFASQLNHTNWQLTNRQTGAF